MIEDGPLFKAGLHRTIKVFERDMLISAWWPKFSRQCQGDYARWRFEQTIFIFALGVRKLIEAAKLSIEVQAAEIEIKWAPRRGPHYPDSLVYDKVDVFYATEALISKKILLLDLCNAITHSFVLVSEFYVGRLNSLRAQSFFVASDRQRRDGVCLVEWHIFVESVVLPVINDDVAQIRIFRIDNGEELRIPSSIASSEIDDKAMVERYSDLSKGNKAAVKKFARNFYDRWGRQPF